MSRRITVFGGSFDPVHDAHLEMARRALSQTGSDEVWFVPVARAVNKPDGPSADGRHRLAMLELALASEPAFRICRREIELGTPQRSVQTLEWLVDTHPGLEWRFLMGEDSWESLDAWFEPDRLFDLAAPVVQPRPGGNAERVSMRGEVPVLWLAGAPLDLSSTSLRQALGRGETPEGLCPPVLDYIRAHGLYEEVRA